MNDKPLRIGIAGCAGTGRSSLARALSLKLGIKMIESKSITNEILTRDGYDYCSGIQVERFLANSSRQEEMLKKTIEAQEREESFITDRTFIDLAAYAVAELHDDDSAFLKKIFNECMRQSSIYTHVFLCPWDTMMLKGNNKRTLNPWYQYLIHSLSEGIMADWGVKYHTIRVEDTESRVVYVTKVLQL